MNKSTLPILLACMATQLHGTIVVSDDFSSYGSGANIDGPWSVTWRNNAGFESQQNLMDQSATGEYMVYDTSTAFHQYYGVNKTSFTLSAGETATISADVRYVHAGGGNPAVANKAAFGIMVDTTSNWWDGSKDYGILSNRGAAVGSTLSVAPWVEGWVPQNTLGIDTAAGGTSDWFSMQTILTDDGANVWIQTKWFNTGGSEIFASSTVDSGLASGSNTLYGGFGSPWTVTAGNATDNGWANNNQVTIEQFSSFSEIHADNFQISVIPEPSSALLAGLGAFGLLRRRRA